MQSSYNRAHWVIWGSWCASDQLEAHQRHLLYVARAAADVAPLMQTMCPATPDLQQLDEQA
jgi:hypothetical protein